MLHTEFAERAARRIEAVAERLEEEGRWLELDTVSARTNELRVAAHLVRNEAVAVTQEETSRGRARHIKNRKSRGTETSGHEGSHRVDRDVVA
jgi:hypothetical protein